MALGLLGEAIQIAERTSEGLYEAELNRLRGELLLQVGRQVREAESSLQKALTVAREQQARFWELRAATTLAQHWHDRAATRRPTIC